MTAEQILTLLIGYLVGQLLIVVAAIIWFHCDERKERRKWQ